LWNEKINSDDRYQKPPSGTLKIERFESLFINRSYLFWSATKSPMFSLCWCFLVLLFLHACCNLLFWLGTCTLKSGGVNIVVWAKNSLKHIWYLIFTYICLCFTLCCLISSVEAILASSALCVDASWFYFSYMRVVRLIYNVFLCCLNARFVLKFLENLRLLLYFTLSLIFPCSWRAVKSIVHIRHYSEIWKDKQWWSTIPPLSANWPTTPQATVHKENYTIWRWKVRSSIKTGIIVCLFKTFYFSYMRVVRLIYNVFLCCLNARFLLKFLENLRLLLYFTLSLKTL
jgi:hypothetical protein